MSELWAPVAAVDIAALQMLWPTRTMDGSVCSRFDSIGQDKVSIVAKLVKVTAVVGDVLVCKDNVRRGF